MGRRCRLSALIPAAAFLCMPLAAVTLEEAQAMAAENNSSLRTQRLTLENARRQKDAGWNSFLPSLSLNGGVSNTHLTETSGDPWNWNASAGLSMTLTAGIPARIRQASLAYDIALADYQSMEQSISAQVAGSFYTLIAEAQNITILEDSLELSRRQYEQTRRNYNSGLASELSMLQAQYAYLSAGPALDTARTAYQASLDAFQTLIGSGEAVVPEGEVPLVRMELPSAEQLAAEYVENRLDIRQRRLAVRQAELARTAQGLETLAPSVNLSESIRLSPASAQAGGDKKINPAGTFSVSVSIPVDGLIPGSSRNLGLKTLDDGIASAQIALETARTQAAQDIEAKVNAINQLWNSIEIARLNLSIAERSYQLSQDGYNAGLVSQTDLETSRQQMVSARQNVGRSETSYLSAVHSLAAALNLSVADVRDRFGAEPDKSNSR